MLRAIGLTKRYAGRTVVDNVSFELTPGTVTAFLGPNGAGKSTTLRMLTGLTPPTRGDSSLAGRRYQDWPNPARLAGVLLDAAAVHPGRTGGGHLRNAARLIGVSRRRVDQVLGEVGWPMPPAGRSGTTASACASGSAWPTRCWPTARCATCSPPAVAWSAGPDLAALSTALTRSGVRVSPDGAGRLLAEAPADQVSQITFRARVRVNELTGHQLDLEDLFFQLSGDARDG